MVKYKEHYCWVKTNGDVVLLDRNKFMKIWYANIHPAKRSKPKKFIVSISGLYIHINNGKVTCLRGNQARGFIALFSAFDKINRDKMKEYAEYIFKELKT